MTATRFESVNASPENQRTLLDIADLDRRIAQTERARTKPSQAGRITEIGPAGIWWAAVKRSEWPEDPEERAEIKANWVKPWGDRQQELVFIGRNMDRAAIEGGLKKALLTDAEVALGMRKWRKFTDPFDPWQMTEPEDADV